MLVVHKAVKGAVWLTGVQIGVMLFSFGANIVLARLLSPKDFGTFSMALSLMVLFSILSTSWSFSTAVIQAKEPSEELKDTGYLLLLGIGGGVFVLVLGSSLFLKRFYPIQVLEFLWIFAALQVMVLLGNYQGALLERELEYGKFSLIRLSSRCLPWLGAILLAWLGARAWSFVGQQVLTAFILFFGYRMLSGHRFKWRFSRGAMRRLFRFGGQMFIAHSLETVFYRFPNFAIGTWAGLTELGYFKQAYTFSEMGHRFGAPGWIHVPFAAYSRLQDQKDNLSRAYEMTNYFLLRFLTPIALLFLLLGEQIIVFLYGEKWRPAGPLLQAFAIYTLAVSIFENMKMLLISQDRIPSAIVARVMQVGFLIPGIYFVLNKFNILEIVYVIDIGMLLGIPVLWFYVRELVQVDFRKLVVPPLLAAFGTLAIWEAGLGYLQDWQPQFRDTIFRVILVFGIYLSLLFAIEQHKLWNEIRVILRILKPGVKIITG